MDISTDNHHFTRLEVVDPDRGRRWSDHEKLQVVKESLLGPRLASATARRYGISIQRLFGWRKAYREGRLCDGGSRTGVVPAAIVAEPEEIDRASGGGRIEILSLHGWRIIVGADVDAAALGRVLSVVEGL